MLPVPWNLLCFAQLPALLYSSWRVLTTRRWAAGACQIGGQSAAHLSSGRK